MFAIFQFRILLRDDKLVPQRDEFYSNGSESFHLLSSLLFKIYIRKALEEWKRKCHGMGVPLENITLYTLQFADDQVVLVGDKEDLEYMTSKLKETYEKWGLDMNLNKTKYLCIGETHNNLKLDNDNEIEFGQEYKFRSYF